MFKTFFKHNLVTLIHSLASLVLFTALTLFFVYDAPDPDYNDLLSVLIGALVTIVTVMFSAVLVALQLASAQFSPRITRAFFGQNRLVQAAFYLFLFGIAYGFAIKFTYSTAKGGFWYPILPMSAAVFGFFLISFVLPRFVFYIADAINAASISRDIALRTVKELDELYGNTAPVPADKVFSNQSPDVPCARVPLRVAGFLDKIDHRRLNALAQRHPQLQFYVELLVGNFVTPGETAIKVIGAGAPVPEGLLRQLNACFTINKYRSFDQDVLFGVRQLVDMGIKAISPAVNDPTTCVNCLHYLGVVVKRYTEVPQPSLMVRQAPANVHYREFTFKMLLDAAFDQIYQWGRGDYMVVCQLLNTFTEIAQGVDNPVYKAALRAQLDAFEIRPDQFPLKEHNERVAKCRRRLEEVL